MSGATSLAIDQGVGSVTGLTSKVVTPGAVGPVTYTLSATNLAGTKTQSVSIQVSPPPPPAINSFTASPSNITFGQSCTLSWNVVGATSLSINQGVGSVTGLTSKVVSPTLTTTYVLTATNASGSVDAATMVTVNAFGTPPTITNFAASPATLTAGQSSTLSWSVAGATSLSINQGIGTVTGTTRVVTPTVTTTYTLTATNSFGFSTGTATVTVLAPSVAISSFTVTPATIALGQSATLAWTTSGATSLAISQGVGTVTGPSGTKVVGPTATGLITYRLTASNGTTTVTRDVSLTVNPAAPVVNSFTTQYHNLTLGQSTLLSWSVSAGASVSISGIGPVTGTSISVTPGTIGTVTYTLTAVNASGSAGAQVAVTVAAAPTLQWRRTSVYGFGTLLSEESSTGTTYIQTDQVGSPNIVTDSAGIVVGRSKNLPYGERFGSIGEKSARRYTNHEDNEGPPQSPIYMQARVYLPVYGRFAQVDPAYDQAKDDPESWNLYSYVTNNPVTKTDPDGRMAFSGDLAGVQNATLQFQNFDWGDVGFGHGASTQSEFMLMASKPIEARAPDAVIIVGYDKLSNTEKSTIASLEKNKRVKVIKVETQEEFDTASKVKSESVLVIGHTTYNYPNNNSMKTGFVNANGEMLITPSVWNNSVKSLCLAGCYSARDQAYRNIQVFFNRNNLGQSVFAYGDKLPLNYVLGLFEYYATYKSSQNTLIRLITKWNREAPIEVKGSYDFDGNPAEVFTRKWSAND